MAQSKNEIKERRGKITCAIAILFPILIFGGFYFFSINIMDQFGESIKGITDKTVEKRIKKSLEREKEIVYREILGPNNRATFTGIEERNDTTFTNALQIKSIDSTSIEYRIESLINWKPQKDIVGIAYLDISSLGSEKWDIQNKEGIGKPAFRFIDSKENCQVEILISKKKDPRSISIINEICGKQTKALTVKLNNK